MIELLYRPAPRQQNFCEAPHMFVNANAVMPIKQANSQSSITDTKPMKKSQEAVSAVLHLTIFE